MTLRCSLSDRFHGARSRPWLLLGVPALLALAGCTGSDGTATPVAAAGQTAGGASGSAGTAGSSPGASSSGAAGSAGAGTSSGSGGAGAGQSGASGVGSAGTSGAGGGGGSGGGPPLTDFSFFVTSMAAIVELSGNDMGFGGDLSYDGKSGVLGADEICRVIAEKSMPGSGVKGWKAFLSTSTENAIDRISGGPWFDRQGRLVASDKEGLKNERPAGSDSAITEDLPNEDGVPNHFDVGPMCKADGNCRDNHDTLTGSNEDGELDEESTTCDDWTSTTAEGRPRIGHSWSAQSGKGWAMAHQAGGCGRGINVYGMGGPQPGDDTVGAGGGYGGFYCFAGMR
jgi:hypothetical protein